MELEQIARIESTRDKTFEEFTNSFADHLEGKIDPNVRTANRPVTSYGDDGVTSQKPKEGGRRSGMSQNPMDEDETVSRKFHSKKGSVASQHMPSKSSVHGSAVNSEFKYNVPNDAKLEFLRTNRISKLDDNYVLLAHPFPQIEGEMLLFQQNIESEDKDIIIYQDFSLRKRMDTPRR